MSVDSNVAFTNTDGAAFPDNESVNASGPSAEDGTEFVKTMIDNYMFGVMQAMLDQTGLVPDGVVESASSSQFLESVVRLTSKGVVFTDSGAADAYVLTQLSGIQAPTAYYDGMEAIFKADFANTGASTVNIAGLGLLNIKLQDGSDPDSGLIPADAFATIRYNLASDRFELIAVTSQATETVAGIAEVATQAETDAGVIDTHIITPLKLRFGFSANLAATGHLKFPDWLGGLKINWASVSEDSTPVPRNYDSAFSTTVFGGVVSASPTTESATPAYFEFNNLSLTQYQIDSSSGTGRITFMIALGV